MKQLYTLLIVLGLAAPAAKAQQVYNIVLDNATRIVNSPTAPYMQQRIAQFKRTALVYIRQKAFEQNDTVSSRFLDTQAYYLSEYLTLFFNEVVKSKGLAEDKRKMKVAIFMESTVQCPLFDDPDEETTMAYITEGEQITPFSLNTDWEKAYVMAKATLAKDN